MTHLHRFAWHPQELRLKQETPRTDVCFSNCRARAEALGVFIRMLHLRTR